VEYLNQTPTKLRDDLDLYSGKIITEALKMNVKNISRNYFIGKGFLKAKASIIYPK
jgi:hypothetical protein